MSLNPSGIKKMMIIQIQNIVEGISNSARLIFSYFRCIKYEMISVAFTIESTTRSVSIRSGRNLSQARNTSINVITASQTQTITNSFVLPTACVSKVLPCALIRSSKSARQIDRHQVDHWKYKHPHQIDEMPVKPAHFHVI